MCYSILSIQYSLLVMCLFYFFYSLCYKFESICHIFCARWMASSYQCMKINENAILLKILKDLIKWLWSFIALELITSDSNSDECLFDAHTLILIHLFPTNYYLLLNANICSVNSKVHAYIFDEGGRGGFQSHITLSFSIKSRITKNFFNQSRVTWKGVNTLSKYGRISAYRMCYQKSYCIQRFSFRNELRFTCHIAFCQTNKDDLLTPRTFSRASYRNIKSYFSSIEHSKNNLKNQDI